MWYNAATMSYYEVTIPTQVIVVEASCWREAVELAVAELAHQLDVTRPDKPRQVPVDKRT